MNGRLVVFLIVCFLAVGSIIVYTKNNIKVKEPEKAKQELSNFGNPDAASTEVGIKSGNPIKSQNVSQNPTQIQNQTPTQGQTQQVVMEDVKELKIEDIVPGNGSEVKSGDTVEVNYLGTLLNGQKFDSSYDRSQTFSFSVGKGEVIAGWDEGLIGMKVGGKRKLTIPADKAYGAQSVGGIPPNSPLLFEIELVSIK